MENSPWNFKVDLSCWTIGLLEHFAEVILNVSAVLIRNPTAA